VLDGGKGHDDFIGSEGSDRIRARDGQSDSISCYGGRDSVSADGHDFVAGGRDTGRCERIRRRGAAAAVAVGEPFVNDADPITVNPKGQISLAIGCPVDGPRGCRGRLIAAVDGVSLGTHRFAVKRGDNSLPTLTVPADRRAGLLGRPALSLTTTVVSRDRRGRRRSVRDRFTVKFRAGP
jgi:hypothetical protein